MDGRELDVERDAYAHDLYANLRTLDKAGCEQILVQEVPGDDKWDAIRDRLLRGAAASEVENAEFASTGALGVLP